MKVYIDKEKIQLHILFFEQKILLFNITQLPFCQQQQNMYSRIVFCTTYTVVKGEHWWLKRSDFAHWPSVEKSSLKAWKLIIISSFLNIQIKIQKVKV